MSFALSLTPTEGIQTVPHNLNIYVGFYTEKKCNLGIDVQIVCKVVISYGKKVKKCKATFQNILEFLLRNVYIAQQALKE